MDFQFPLVRFSTELEHLEELQKGTMYLRNACHYRRIESTTGDTVQGDLLDCKIPYSGAAFEKAFAEAGLTKYLDRGLTKAGVTKEDMVGDLSLMGANTFICCMFAFNSGNVMGCDEKYLLLKINEDQDKLRKFGGWALVICNPERFIQSFDNAKVDCRRKFHGYVDYRDLQNQAVADKISDVFITSHFNANPQNLKAFELIKSTAYAFEQEYRFVVNMEYAPEDIRDEYRMEIKTDGKKIDVEDCTAYSFICQAEDILTRTLCLKRDRDNFEAGFLRENTINQ